jgi:hypothetical protein
MINFNETPNLSSDAVLRDIVKQKEVVIESLEAQLKTQADVIERETAKLNVLHITIIGEKAALKAITSDKEAHGLFSVNLELPHDETNKLKFYGEQYDGKNNDT